MAAPERGGRQGRHALRQRVAPVPENTTTKSSLAQHLLSSWSWGHISSAEVQKYAFHAHADEVALLTSLGLSADQAHADLKHLAELGQEGRDTGNLHVQLLNYLGNAAIPPPFWHRVPMAHSKTSARDGHDPNHRMVDFPVFLPHVVFAYYHSTHKARFEELFLGSFAAPAQRQQFWEELERRGDPRILEHPIRRGDRRDWRSLCIPLSLHGDGVPVLRVGKAGNQSFEAYSMQSL